MDRFITSKQASFRIVMLMLGGLILSVVSANSAHSAWFERLLLNNNDTAQEDTYKVKDAERNEIFVIDDFIYDARETCYLSVGDKVMFFEGQYGVDYYATVYDLNSAAYCELLLRDPVSLG